MMEGRTSWGDRSREEVVLKFSARKTVFIFRKVLHILGWCSAPEGLSKQTLLALQEPTSNLG